MSVITPDKIQMASRKKIPEHIIDSVSEMIAATWDGNRARFTQKDLMDLVLDKSETPTRHQIFEQKLFDFEYIFRREGWVVEYDKPGYNESYDATFTFAKDKIDKETLIAMMLKVEEDCGHDYEALHSKHDELLLRYIGSKEVTEIFNRTPKHCS